MTIATFDVVSSATFDRPRPDRVDSPERLAAVRRSNLLGAQAGRRFSQLTELASTLTGAPIALITTVEADRQFFTSHAGLPSDLARTRQTPISQSVCRTVVETGEPLELGDLAADIRFVDHGARTHLGVQAYCGVPIRDRDGHVLGSFCVLDDRRRDWAPDTVAVLERLAAVVGESISTSADYMMLVSDLQSRLIPAELVHPESGTLEARYRPVATSEQIGGDFYDSFLRRDGTVDVVIGDVVGHGLESTQAAAQLRAAARAVFTGAERSPAQIINRISESCADLPGCMCAAIIVASISADGRHVRWARAGAMPPVRSGPNPHVLDGPSSPPLGVGRCEPDEICSVDLQPGEGLLFFTDGLVERRDEGIDDGLARVVAGAAQALGLDELIELANPADIQSDDLAVVRWSLAC